MRRTKCKKSRGLVTRRITYRNRLCPDDRPQEVTIDVRRGEHVETEYAAAMVALRTGTSLAEVMVVEIGEPGA